MENTNYFGRACRFLGRICLFVGFILGIGVCALLIASPFTVNTGQSATGSPSPVSQSSTSPNHYLSLISSNQFISWFITGAIITATIVAICYLAKRYNNTIRNAIANIAHRTKIPIHMLELGLTLIIWSITIILIIFSLPVASTILIFPFIINELLFLFGWISYDMPDYKV